MDDQKEKSYYSMFQEYSDIVTVEEVEEMLQVSKNTVYGLIKSRKIGGKLIGKGYKIPKIFVIKYVTEKNNEILEDGQV